MINIYATLYDLQHHTVPKLRSTANETGDSAASDVLACIERLLADKEHDPCTLTRVHGEALQIIHINHQRRIEETLAARGPRGPVGGDAVRLATRWEWGGVEKGSIGMIDGYIDAPRQPDDVVSITFNPSTYRDFRTASSSGGPGTIATDVGDLRATDEMVDATFWCWPGLSRPHGSVHYRMPVRVWLWSPAGRT